MANTDLIGRTRKLTVTAIMSAVAFILMMLEFSTPLTPEFLKFDVSDLPAMITSFALGPVWGVAVELIKNLLHMPLSHTSFVGELANFIAGSALVFPSGLVYKKLKTRKGALIGAIIGTLISAIISFPVNYFITYPFYFTLIPREAVISMYSAIIPAADTLEKALLIVNVPFTAVKGIISTVITFLSYKKLSPILHGRKKGSQAND